MADPHTALGIAQIVFYAPLVPISIYLLIRNWSYRPRTAWYPAVPFTTIRLASGILTIIEEQNPGNRTLIIVTIVFLNIGLVPLVLSFSGITRLVVESSLKGDEFKRSSNMLKIIRWNIIIAAALLGTAGGFAGQAEKATTQKTLSIVAYVLFAALVVGLIALCGALYHGNWAKEGDRIYLKGALLASIFICIRTAYGLIGIFEASGANILTSIWSPLFGSAVAFCFMALVPEYIALCVFIYLSVYRLRSCKATQLNETDCEL
ncbi:hypothetical protein V8F33_002344 [Rhypophila sp. PSN 637]